MYYIVEIRPNGSETFLEGFEEFDEAWNVLSRLQCEAQASGERSATRFGDLSMGGVVKGHVASCCAPASGVLTRRVDFWRFQLYQ
jgi:hypothetical protein